MPAPTNTDFTTATAITLPASVSQNPHFGGTQYTLYFVWTATQTGMVGVWGFGDLTAYTPRTVIYVGPADDPEPVDPPVAGRNVPCQFWATAGQQYFLEVQAVGANDNPAIALALEVEDFDDATVARGTYAINSEVTGYPLALLSPSTGAPIAFQDAFPAGEHAVSMSSGYVIVHDIAVNKPKVYNPQRALVATMNLTGYLIVTCNATSLYAAFPYDGMTEMTVKQISTAGVVVATDVVTPTTGLVAMGVNAAGTILYYVQDPAANVPINRWDLSAGVALSDLVAGQAGFGITRDVIVLADDTILAAYFNADPLLHKVMHFSAAGATLHSYTIPRLNRICTSADDPVTFIAWHKPTATDTSQFREVRVSDGATVLETPEVPIFDDGEYVGTATATPLGRYGHAGSCPIWVQRATTLAADTYPIRRMRRCLLPSSPDNKRVQIPLLELLMRTGIGLTPGPASDPPVLGSDPQVMLRISKDGGKTWGPERWRTAGQIGRFADRVRWLRATGQYRNAVVEVTVSDPVNWEFLGLLGEPVEGSS